MINDILFCLLGYTGGAFIDTGSSFSVNDTMTCIVSSEKELLKKIADIGFKYKLLKDIIKNYEDLFNQELIRSSALFGGDAWRIGEGNSVSSNSIYLSSVSFSLDEFLKGYEQDVEALESKFYTEQILTVSEIIASLEPYLIKFEKLWEFFQYVYQKNLKGGDFLNFLYECSISGDPGVRSMFRMLFINANKILISFITFWIINNTASHNEFFIISSNNIIVKEDNTSNNMISSQNNSNFTYTNKDLESWTANYYIEYNNIPFYFPHALAEDILFVGKALKILNSNKNAEEDKVPFNDISVFYTSLQKLNDLIFNENNNQEMINMIDIEFLTKIIVLIKNCSAKYLWKLVVNKKGFLDHLNAVKNIFLTFHGEFYFNFIMKIHKLLNSPSFDKKIENEINEVYFKSSMKEVFNIDTDEDNFNIYSGFRIKLISSGFNYNFQEESNVKGYLDKKEISFLGGLNYDTVSNSFRMINTTYKGVGGALWNLASFDIDEEFNMSNNFIMKNFTKNDKNAGNASTRGIFLSPRTTKENDMMLRSSLIKSKKSETNAYEQPSPDIRKVTLNYILHITKNIPPQPPLNVNDLTNYFNFQFVVNFDPLNPGQMAMITFKLRYVNKFKKILLQNDNPHYIQISDHEIEIFSKTFTEDLQSIIPSSMDMITNIQFSFKENYCTIFNESKLLNFSFPFAINQFIPKEKRKMTLGFILSSDNLDIIFEIISWNFNIYSGEIYNENSNLILINYNPPWPHNFIFNENILKMYNMIFNLIFPLKTNLTLLNQLWVEKKNQCKKENSIFRLIDSVHAEYVCFLQNLISFYMFDVIDLKFKNFFSKIKDCKDLEELILHHEEFLGEVITNSFVKSKKIMRVIFDILFVIRKFHNYIANLLINFHNVEVISLTDPSKAITVEQQQTIMAGLIALKEEFKAKVKNLVGIFTKIKNTKHFAIISQLLAKIERTEKQQESVN